MPKRKLQSPPIDVIEADYIAALRRLEEGRPENKELKKLLLAGRLKINISSVAKEAQRSRTLLATDGGKYARVRQMVLLSKLGGHTHPPRTANETITTLRARVAELKAKLQAADSLNLSYLERMRAAEREAERLRAQLQRERIVKEGRNKVVDLNLVKSNYKNGEGG